MITDLFKTPIFKEQIDFKYRDELEHFILDYKEKNSSVVVSNVGGWQSDSLLEKEELSQLRMRISSYGRLFMNSIGIHMTKGPTAVWANVNKYKDYNAEHIHTGKISGVYYVKAPENCGDIFFKNPYTNLISSAIVDRDDYVPTMYTGDWAETPKDDLLILFPSWVSHSVFPNLNKNEDRISVSFNIN